MYRFIKIFYQIVFTIYCWSLFVFLWLFSTFIATILTLGTKNKESVFNKVERIFSRIAFRLIGMNVEVSGVENVPKDEPVIFVSNHQSMLDIKISLACIPVDFSFISKDSIFRVPLLGTYMAASGHIPIQRTENKRAYETIMTTIEKMKARQKSLMVFPEGTRSEHGELGSFKRGISFIILKSGRRVVPMAISGSCQFMPKGRWLSDPEKRHVKVCFGKPLSFDKTKIDREYTLQVTDILHKKVQELLDIIQE